MTRHYASTMFTPQVKAAQSARASRMFYERLEDDDTSGSDVLSPREAEFIARRDSFYMATTSETGWPYIQHRGGPAGFLKVIDNKTLGFADYRGNRQYMSVGNMTFDNKVSLIMVDYPGRRRLKLIGRMRLFEADDMPELVRLVSDPDYGADVERAFFIHVEAFDWNCPQHITPRYSEDELVTRTAKLTERITELEQKLSWYAPGCELLDK